MITSHRTAAHKTASRALAATSDDALAALLADARQLGTGIGGATVEFDIEGVRVFAKKIPLTDLELLPENLHSTRNVFELPTFYQYPMGSAGFGAWREVAAHTMTTDWALNGGFDGFPLTYHWRALPGKLPATAGIGGFNDRDEAVARWDGSAAVRRRLESIAAATHYVAVFLEHIPQRLNDHLYDRPYTADTDLDFTRAEARLAEGVAFMQAHGFVHFDAHFNNILTDGEQVYFTDFGLAACTDFDLSSAERRFLAAHRGFDHACVYAGLATRSIDKIRGGAPNLDVLRAWIAGDIDRTLLPPRAAALVDRYAPFGVLTLDYHRKLEEPGKAGRQWPVDAVTELLRTLPGSTQGSTRRSAYEPAARSHPE